MDLTLVTACPSPAGRLIALFCFFWPFVSIAVIRKRGHSSAPVAAMLLPLAVALLGTWIGIMETLRGMALSGSGIAASAAGFAEALHALFTGACSAAGVAVVALIKRHRPVVDWPTALIASLFAAGTIGALLFLRFFSFEIAALVFVGIGIAAAIALAAAVWLALVAANWRRPSSLPAAGPAIAVCMVLLAVLVWYDLRRYTEIAMYGFVRS